MSCCVLFLMQSRITYHYKYQWQRCLKSVFWHGCCHASVGKPFRVSVGGCRNGKQMAPKWNANNFEWIEMVLNGFKWLWNGFKMVFSYFFAFSKNIKKKHFRSISDPFPKVPKTIVLSFSFSNHSEFHQVNNKQVPAQQVNSK